MKASKLTLETYVRSLIANRGRRYPSPFVISAVGSGGKTTTLIDLFAASIRPRSILTSTTSLGVPGSDDHLGPPLSETQKANAGLSRVSLSPPPVSGVWLGPPYEDAADKHRGVDKEELDTWVRRQRNDGNNDAIVLCEADGSKRKPLKAYADHEPVIPNTTDLTLILFGLSGLGKPMNEFSVHRAHLFSQATGLKTGEPVGMVHLILLLRSGHFFKGIPPTSKVAVVFNQVDCLEEEERTTERLYELAMQILDIPQVNAVFFTGEEKGEPKSCYGLSKMDDLSAPFSAVVMAAGTSERMEGQNKLLLPLGDQTLVARTVSRVLESDVRDLVVVLGHEEVRVQEAINKVLGQDQETSVTFVTNDRYREGQGTSVAAGTLYLARDNLACFFIPGDQPFVSPLLLRHLMEEFEPGRILVPLVNGTRSSPVLFDRRFYEELSALTGDLGGRQVIRNHPDDVIEIPGSDPAGGFDLDTPEDYERALTIDME